MTKILHGIVRGTHIEISQEIGVPDGEEVEIVVRPVKQNGAGEGILRSAGGWTDYPEIDAVMEQIQAERKTERRVQGQL